MATKRQKHHKILVRNEHNIRWFDKSVGILNHLAKRDLGLPRNYRLKAISKLEGR